MKLTEDQITRIITVIEEVLNEPQAGDCVNCGHVAHDVCACGCTDYD